MIDRMQKAQVIALYRSNIPIRQISRITGISRNTVRKYISEYLFLMDKAENSKSDEESAFYQEAILGRTKMKIGNRPKTIFTGDLKTRFETLLESDEERNRLLGSNKQQLNAAVLWRELVDEGFDVGQTTIRKYFREYKQKHPEVFIRQQYDPGERMEYDFHQIKVVVNNRNEIYHQATMSFPYSNHVIGFLFKNETSKSVMNSLIQAFNEIDGVPKTVVFDNLSPVVKRYVYWGEKQYTDMIVKLSAYYGFDIVTCNPSSGNEKGHVENSGKTIRSNFFSLKYKFNSEEELYAYFKKQVEKHNKSSINEWILEKQTLKKKPIHDFLLVDVGKANVNSYSCICIRGNFYSVKEEFIEKTVNYKVINDSDVIIDYQGEVIGRHKLKVDGTGNYVIDITHFLKTFLKKPNALPHSVALRQAEKNLRAIYENNYKGKPREFVVFLLGGKIEECKSIEDVSNRQLQQVSELFNQA